MFQKEHIRRQEDELTSSSASRDKQVSVANREVSTRIFRNRACYTTCMRVQRVHAPTHKIPKKKCQGVSNIDARSSMCLCTKSKNTQNPNSQPVLQQVSLRKRSLAHFSSRLRTICACDFDVCGNGCWVCHSLRL